MTLNLGGFVPLDTVVNQDLMRVVVVRIQIRGSQIVRITNLNSLFIVRFPCYTDHRSDRILQAVRKTTPNKIVI
jgi:hypothetical protein